MNLRHTELKSPPKRDLKRGILNIAWLWLALAIVLPATTVVLLTAKPAEAG
jgi:hypothetical protein